MVIPREITAEEYEKASDEDKAMYEAGSEEGKYSFVGVNAGELKRAKERVSSEKNLVKQELEALKKKVSAFEAAKEEAEHKKVVDRADSEAVNKKWQQKYDRDIAEQKQNLAQLQDAIRQQHRNTVIENEVASSALPQFKDIVRMLYDKRVDVELGDDNIPKIVVKDEDGKVGFDTIKDLTASLKKDSRYKDILKGDSVGSGAVKQTKPDAPRPPVSDPVGRPSLEQQVRTPYSGDYGADLQKYNTYMNAPAEELEKFTGPLPDEEEDPAASIFKTF